jgi:beta-galactosidase
MFDEAAGLLPPTEADAWAAVHARMAPPLPGLVSWRLELPDVRAWSAEDPALTGIRVSLHAPDGSVAETAELRVGFRRVEILGLDLLVNGARVFIRGVNPP